jgi:hypothetical protein
MVDREDIQSCISFILEEVSALRTMHPNLERVVVDGVTVRIPHPWRRQIRVAAALRSILRGEDANKALGLVAPEGTPPDMAKIKGPLSAEAIRAAHREVRRWLYNKEGHKPFSLRQLAALVGVSKTSIIKWRRDPRYEQAVKDEAVRPVNKRLNERERARKAATPKPKRNMEQLDVDAHNNWAGPTQCMACGKMFNDPTSYVAHIWDDHPEVGYAGEVTSPPTKLH